MAATDGNTMQKRELDAAWTTDPSQFYRRKYHSSLILGDVLYIDGGDLTHHNSDGTFLYVPSNSTYSLDLSESWSPGSVRFNAIDKGDCPVLNRPNLWPAEDGKSYYSYNGDVSQARPNNPENPPNQAELWQFTPDGVKDGTWKRAEYVPTTFIQSQGSKSALGNNTVHILGGEITWRSTNLLGGKTSYRGSADGVLSYDLKSGAWQNRSMTAFAPSGWWLEGELQRVSLSGGTDLMVALGGMTALAGYPRSGESLMDLSQIGLFDPISGEWSSQSTTGSIPPSRARGCSVGVPGDNGTYEIFLYGGGATPLDTVFQSITVANIELDQVWVLSLPSFTWYKSTYLPQNPRFSHTCQVPGDPPRRQMLVIGGGVPNLNDSLEGSDSFPQGIGVFDLTEMQWTSSYNSDAELYITPQIVKAGIAANGTYPQTWDEPKTALWLTGKSPDNLSNNNSSTSTDTVSASANQTLSTGAIAGIVVGIVCAIVAAVSLWLLLRKRSRAQSRLSQPHEKPPLNGSKRSECISSEVHGDPLELPRIHKVSNAAERAPIYEMPGAAKKHELSSIT